MKVRKSLAHLSRLSGCTDYHPLSIDPTKYADHLFGVGSATSAGPTLPACSIHPSPETLECDCGGYTRRQPIVGFGNAYISGSGGQKCYGNFLLAPTVETAEPDREKRDSFVRACGETARCFECAGTLENRIGLRCSRKKFGRKKYLRSLCNLAGKRAECIQAHP